ncbi:MAG: Crp/Fnr family transcriptional regulator [Cyanobium sp.]|jgi:hypothetical protein
MSILMPERSLQLNLSAGESLPCTVGWLIEDGYLRVASWCEPTQALAFGLWGPGDLVVPALLGQKSIELLSLSPVQVKECQPSREQEQAFLCDQLGQVYLLLQLSRVRPVELRLYRFLLWIGERFGRVSSRGVSLSLDDMNLTHRQLAEFVGTSRVSITKALSRFRQEGQLIKDGRDELLLPSLLERFQDCS